MSYLFHVSKVFLTPSIMFRYRNGFLSIFPDSPLPAKDVIYQTLFNVNDTDGEPQEHGDVTIEVISLICQKFYCLQVL
jgi:hypothetical protein